ncbi:ABC transporter permease subunit [Streptomyces sp. NPDC007369]|uniref:ABC transporter permease subunit n=1 Tax=Streptomyces sp. NPDC007369 TaxID=3154589 RepID=UPI00340024E9
MTGAVAPAGRLRAGRPRTGHERPGRPDAEHRPPAALAVPAAIAAAFALLPLGCLAVRSLERGPAFALDVAVPTSAGSACSAAPWPDRRRRRHRLPAAGHLAGLADRTHRAARRPRLVGAGHPAACRAQLRRRLRLAFGLPGLAGFTGSALALTLVSFPYVYLPVTAALRGTDPAQEEVSRSLGHGPLRTFLRVALPQLRPAAAGGAVLVAL